MRTLLRITGIAFTSVAFGMGQAAEIHDAAAAGDVAAMERLLREDPRALAARTEFDFTPLLLAVKANKSAAVKWLLDKGASIQVTDSNSRGVLHWVALAVDQARFAEAMESLERSESERAKARAKDGQQPHHSFKFTEIAVDSFVTKSLLDSLGPDGQRAFWRIPEILGASAVSEAALADRLAILDMLTTRGAFVEAKDKDGQKPLHFAAMSSGAITQRLLAAGADPLSETTTGTTALHLAAITGSAERVRTLLAAGISANSKDSLGQVPLHLAANVAVAETLIVGGAKPDERDGAGMTALHHASHVGRTELAQWLLKIGLRHDQYDAAGFLPLHTAAENGHPTTTQLLLDLGTPVDARRATSGHTSPGGGTALMEAARTGHAEVVRLLIQGGARLDARNVWDQTALHGAAMAGSASVAELLFAAHGKPNLKDRRGWTPLHYAAAAGWFQRQASNQPTRMWIPPSQAVLLVSRVLLGHGADPNVQDPEGRTPLHWAAESEAPELVEALLRHGARTDLHTSDGLTPIRIAERAGNPKVIEILSRRPARNPTANQPAARP